MKAIEGHLEIEGNLLHMGGVPYTELADEFGTPQYVYNVERVLENYRRIRDGLEAHADRDVVVYYAVKANFNPALLEALAGERAHADVLSVHEAEFALRAGFPAERIMFTGTSVTDETMEHLLERSILINIDSFSQMRRLAELTPEGLEVSIRWNPGEGVGCLNWGLVNGRTQTIYPWGSEEGSPEPETWFHEILHKDGTPYRLEEVEFIRVITSGDLPP